MELNDPVVTDQALKAFAAFVAEADLQITSRGLRNLLIDYFKTNQVGRELWFDEFLLEVTSLFDFLDELSNIFLHA